MGFALNQRNLRRLSGVKAGRGAMLSGLKSRGRRPDGDCFMNATMTTADATTHLKIVTVAVLAAMALIWVALAVH
jgi:hypothetical protein